MTQEKSRITHHASHLLNPIIVKELRTHMRGSRAFSILTGYLLILGLLAYGLYRITLAGVQQSYGPGMPSQSAHIGQTLFIGLAFLELLSVCFITPALTAGVISGEIERRTYDMLLATPLRPASILWGKMVASLTYVNLLILAAIPLSSVVFLFGGVALRDVIQAIGLLALTAITYGTLGLFFSALTRRTGRAMVLSYLAVLFLTLGSAFLWVVTGAVTEQMPPREIVYVNPISAMASAIISPGTSSGFYGMSYELLYLLGGGPDVMALSSSRMPMPTTTTVRPLWQYTTAIYLALTVVCYLLTTQLVKPVRRWRIGWRGLIALLIILALLAAGSLVVFGTDWGSTGWRGSPTPTPAPFPIVEEVFVERVVEMPVPPAMPPPPTATPAPPPIPTPTPISFDASEHEAAFEAYLPQELLPDGKGFCDLDILWTRAEFEYGEIIGWVYCRTFSLADGELVPSVGTSTIARLDMYWTPQDWQIGGCIFGNVQAMTPPEVQQRLLENPYDEAAGEERLRERARQELLGE